MDLGLTLEGREFLRFKRDFELTLGVIFKLEPQVVNKNHPKDLQPNGINLKLPVLYFFVLSM